MCIRDSIDVLDELHDLAVEGVLVSCAATVTVKLDMREVTTRVAERLHRFERRGPVARHPEVIGVQVNRVRKLQRVNGARDLLDDLPRCHTEVRDVLVQSVHLSLIHISEPTRLLSISYAV